jgi:predicted nucleotidyltransferase
MPRNIRKILVELKKGLVEIFGDQLNAVYLFGSFARGEGKLPDSDIDVMIVMNGDNDRDFFKQCSQFVSDLCLKHDAHISCKFVSKKYYQESKMPFMLNVKDDAIAI